ncbi:MAG: DUF1836 domain-containing protein [Lachnospiraceae bacterium]|nr:DUF1836 domain-containing protein [Lachnospiraceae bacterium]
MGFDRQKMLESVLESLDRISIIKPEDVPNIDMYMDQVTTFMDGKLRTSYRGPQEDKVLTKTMINNYAKNDLIPAPVKKKYSKEHVLLLVFIYYYKSILSISDIQMLLQPITDKYFFEKDGFNLTDIYNEVRDLEYSQIEYLKEDIKQKFARAGESFEGAPDEDMEFLQQFAFICMLSFDVYMKKVIIEKMLDDMTSKVEKNNPKENGKEKKSDKKAD